MRKICIFFFLLHILPTIDGHLGLRPAQFTQYNVWMPWADAQAICQRNNTELVTIYDEQENDFFIKGGGWIGLHREDGSNLWKWSENNQITNYENWKDEPHYDCALKYRNESRWRTDDCNRGNLFMCYERLLLVKDNKTWEEALEHCKSLGDKESPGWNHSYDLATLMTADDITYARQKAQLASSNEVWIGLRFLGHSWFWVGGEQLENQDFPSCPAFRCGVLNKSSGVSFENQDCSERRNFFCYRSS